jgi:hypothetical protein
MATEVHAAKKFRFTARHYNPADISLTMTRRSPTIGKDNTSNRCES